MRDTALELSSVHPAFPPEVTESRVQEQIAAVRDRARSVSTLGGTALRWRNTTADDPLAETCAAFQLSQSERRLLWTLIAHELCPVSRALLRELSTEQAADVTTDVMRRVVYENACAAAAWRDLDSESTLRRCAFIDRTDSDAHAPEYRQTWKVTRRLLTLLVGVRAADPELVGLAQAHRATVDIASLELGANVLEQIDSAFEGSGLVVAHGRAGSGRRSVLVAAAQARGLRVLELAGRQLSPEREVLRRQLRVFSRECRLLGYTPLIRDLDALAARPDKQDHIDLVEDELTGLTLATSSAVVARRWSRPPTSVELPPISTSQRSRLWARSIPDAGSGDAELLATRYPLAPALIELAGRIAVKTRGDEAMQPHHVEAGLRAVLDDRLVGLARRVECTQTWNDIVLPEDQAVAMTELLARVSQRTRVYEDWGLGDKIGKGLGVTALFSGPPGTGKTMAAGLVARTLRVEMYQVDLSKVVSKWIGETEKNLAALFDAAEAGHAILLFDEADALFGKRTEVKSSHDRHANQEVNFLLQRLESYTGLCILTTNHDSAMDEAFRRRLSVHVRFPMPDTDERERLWRTMLEVRAPQAPDLGLAALASTYVMSGGYIRNAVVRAAFLAAADGGEIDAARLARAAQLEYEALGKIASRK